MTTVTIPSSVTSIGEGTFAHCTALTSIAITSSVSFIGKRAFEGCTALTFITIPSSVASIGERAFYGCICLASVTIPCSVSTIGKDTFSRCTGLSSATIRSGVTTIGTRAFNGCTSLEAISLPDTIQEIEALAFSNCPAIKAVIVAGWRSVQPFNRRFVAPIFKDGGSAVEIVDAPNSIVRQLGGVCKSITRYNDLPAEVRLRALRLFWSVETHWSSCRVGLREVVWMLLLVGEALQREEVAPAALPDLQPELWLHIMSFVHI